MFPDIVYDYRKVDIGLVYRYCKISQPTFSFADKKIKKNTREEDDEIIKLRVGGRMTMIVIGHELGGPQSDITNRLIWLKTND